MARTTSLVAALAAMVAGVLLVPGLAPEPARAAATPFPVDLSGAVVVDEGARDAAFFLADDGEHGTEVWRTDGTPAGTALYLDTAPGPASTSLDSLIGTDQGLLGHDPTAGLQRVTPDGLRPVVVDGEPLAAGSGVRHVGDLGNAVDGDLRTILLDVAGARLVVLEPGSDEAVPLAASTGVHPEAGRWAGGRDLACFVRGPEDELWCTDGTDTGTTRVAGSGATAGLAPRRLVGAAGGVYFLGTDAGHGEEPWWTDGTPTRTRRVADLGPGAADAPVGQMVGVQGHLFVVVRGHQIWTINTTSASTRMLVDVGQRRRPLTLTAGYRSVAWVHRGDLWASTYKRSEVSRVYRGDRTRDVVAAGSFFVAVDGRTVLQTGTFPGVLRRLGTVDSSPTTVGLDPDHVVWDGPAGLETRRLLSGTRPFDRTSRPRIVGKPVVGRTLRVRTGTWSPRPRFRYRWYVDGTALRRTSARLPLKAWAKGKKIRVRVTGVRKFRRTEHRTSRAVRVR